MSQPTLPQGPQAPPHTEATDRLDVMAAWMALQKQRNFTTPRWIGQGAAALNSLDALIRRG